MNPIPPAPQATLGTSRSSHSHFPRFLVSALALLLCATSLPATTVVLQGGFGYPATHAADGTPIPSGHKVSVGTFKDGFDPATANPSDLTTLLANWLEFGFTTTEVIDGIPGSYWLKHTNSTPTFQGKKIYLFLTRTSDQADPAADGSNVIDYALFNSSHPAWVFRLPPSDTNLPPNDLTQINTSQITSAIWGDYDSVTLAFNANYSDSPSAWDEWVASVFGPTPDAALTDKSAVVAADGLQNFVHFALASNPLEATAPPYQVITVPGANGGPDSIGITFTRKKPDISGYTTTAHGSSNLTAWDLPLASPLIEPVEGDPDAEKVTVFPAEATDKAFFHIRVEPSTPN